MVLRTVPRPHGVQLAGDVVESISLGPNLLCVSWLEPAHGDGRLASPRLPAVGRPAPHCSSVAF